MDVDRFGWRMIELMPQLIRGFAHQESNYLSRGQITLPQLWVLEYLSREGDCPMHQISQFLGVSSPVVTGITDRLIAQGLVRRSDDADDRRIVRIHITPKGKRIVADIWEQKRRALTKVFGHISPSDRAQYLATLERVVQILSKRQPEKSGRSRQRKRRP